MKPWERELSPERLFRGWWEELTKAYKRFCLQDESDCARKCNTEHGTCNLWEDKHEVNKAKTWKYRCECDPGYGPQEDTNTDGSSQYLCSKKISQRDREKCDTLDYEDGKAITPAILDKHLMLPNGGRQKRMVGKYTNFANNYFLPAVVDVFYQTVPVKSQSSCLFKSTSGHTSSTPRRRGSYNHQCGGTLMVLNDGSEKNWSNKVYTASHCFCKLGFDKRCNWTPDPKHFFIRIGLIDNTMALNPTWTDDYKGPKDDDDYIDVRVTHIKLQDTGYLENYCENVEENGQNDIAIMTLDRKIDLSKLDHVKPACNYKDYAWTEITAFKGDNKWKSNLDCYAGGWGLAKDKSGLGLSDRMKFAKVEIVDPIECQRNIASDDFLFTMIESDVRDATGEWPVICAGGFSDDDGGISNTAGGDSGGGLYCFDKDRESTYYFMGALHGGNEDATKDRYMYFSNNAYEPYSKIF